MIVYYQINYTLTEVPGHRLFPRPIPPGKSVPFKEVYTILDGVQRPAAIRRDVHGLGRNNAGWWGEGEIKFYLDGDKEFPTICGTGTEDYFCGSYNFDPGLIDRDRQSAYQEFNTPYAGLPQVIRPDGIYASQTRFGLYRWHIRIRCGSRRISGDHPGARLAH